MEQNQNHAVSSELVCHDLKWIENAAEWKDLYSLACVKSVSDKRGEVSRYYIINIPNLTSKQAYELARGHWSVENKLHWQLDVSLREDNKRNRKEFSAENFSLLRKTVLNIAQIHEPKLSKKESSKRMMRNACKCSLKSLLNSAFSLSFMLKICF